MTATITDVARNLGLSERAVRLRLDALGAVIDEHLKHGDKNRLVFNGEALAILRRMEDLRSSASISVRQAASRIREELDSNRVKHVRQAESNMPPSGVSELVATLQRVIEDQREEIAFLRHQVETLTPLALPKPRRGFLTLFKRRGD